MSNLSEHRRENVALNAAPLGTPYDMLGLGLLGTIIVILFVIWLVRRVA